MRQTGEGSGRGRSGGAGQGRRIGSGLTAWAQVALGSALAAMATLVLFLDWEEGVRIVWWFGGTAFASSLTLVVSGMHRLARLEEMEQGVRAFARVFPAEEMEAPRLGTLLVDHYQLISAEELERGLAEQRRSGGRLGEVLVRLGLIAEAELARALRIQEGLRDPWRDTPRES